MQMAKSKPTAKADPKATPAKPAKAATPAPAPAAKATAKAAPAPTPAPVAKGKAKGKAPAAPAPAPKVAAPAPKAMTKTAIYQSLAEATKLSRTQVGEVFDALVTLIKQQVGKEGPGVMKLPGLIKLSRVTKEATPEHEKPDPFNKGEMMTVKAKEARTLIKVSPLKDLKELIK